MIEVAIIGGGPAGAYCAYNLAENGIHPTIFDHSHPREKPCGGMISPLAQELFPFLKNLPIEYVRSKTIHFTTPFGRKISVNLREKEFICVSRLEFDWFLLNTAMDRGAEWKKERVVEIKREGNIWKVKTDRNNVYMAKIIVGADGVNSIVRRKVAKPLKSIDKGICYGYFTENIETEDISIHFLPHKKGYVWVTPRRRNASIGIGCAEVKYSLGLQKELNSFIKEKHPKVKIISRWSALIPNIKKTETFCSPTAGPSWVLIGDAAGHVNPINGEGILYALLDGELASQAIIENDTISFESLWRNAYELNLLLSSKLQKWIYKTFFMELYCMYIKLMSLM